MTVSNVMNVKIVRNEYMSFQYEVEMSEECFKSMNLQFSSFCLLLPKNDIKTSESDTIENIINENKFIISKLSVFLFMYIIDKKSNQIKLSNIENFIK